MGRAPCCEKMGLKKGPWSPEEDQILINYIQQHGHGNWRALPKQAGLLRCGKSCRLRWINYLRPDIKRGNFTVEEEEEIIHLHETLGNKWSAIAAKLPGRTDNEIKNVWHTHLKKRLHQNEEDQQDSSSKVVDRKRRRLDTDNKSKLDVQISKKESESESESGLVKQRVVNPSREPSSPQLSNSEISSLTATTATSSENNNLGVNGIDNTMEYFEDISGLLDENFLSAGGADQYNSHSMLNSSALDFGNSEVDMDQMILQGATTDHGLFGTTATFDEATTYADDDNMDFWLNILTRAGDLSDLLDI